MPGRAGAAGEAQQLPPARSSREKLSPQPPPPPRPSERRRGWRAGRSGGSELGGGSRRARPPPCLPPSMGAGASRPPQQSVEGELGAVTLELGLSSLRGRARQDRWPSTYQLAVRLVLDAFALVQPRANLGRRSRRARGHAGVGEAGVQGSGPRAAVARRRGVLGLVWAIPGAIRCAGG